MPHVRRAVEGRIWTRPASPTLPRASTLNRDSVQTSPKAMRRPTPGRSAACTIKYASESVSRSESWRSNGRYCRTNSSASSFCASAAATGVPFRVGAQAGVATKVKPSHVTKQRIVIRQSSGRSDGLQETPDFASRPRGRSAFYRAVVLSCDAVPRAGHGGRRRGRRGVARGPYERSVPRNKPLTTLEREGERRRSVGGLEHLCGSATVILLTFGRSRRILRRTAEGRGHESRIPRSRQHGTADGGPPAGRGTQPHRLQPHPQPGRLAGAARRRARAGRP